jgi:parallel beta-helix repeat protein
LRRSGGIDARGPHNKLINLVIHDMSDGMGLWDGADDTGAYGNIIFYNGWEGPDRSHGHGIYTQNRHGVREIEGNIIYNQFSHGIHAYGSSVAYLDNITLRGNIVFGNGSIARSSGERDILLGGGRVAHDAVIEDNATYGPEQSNVGYAAGCLQTTIARNYFSGLAPLILESCRPDMTGNTFVGPMGSLGSLAAAYPRNHYAAAPAHGHEAIVRPNRYDPSRVHIAIYNWDQDPEVSIDLSSVLSDGAAYQLVDVQDYFGPPVLTGVYRQGTPVAIPMTGVRVTPVIGQSSRPPSHTGPEFGAFVLRVLTSDSPADRIAAAPRARTAGVPSNIR